MFADNIRAVRREKESQSQGHTHTGTCTFVNSAGASLTNRHSKVIDPTPFAAFGVLGGLLFVVVILALLVRNILETQFKRFEANDQVLMGFVNDHRKETTASLDNVATKVASGHDKLATIIERHTRKLDEFLLTREVLSRVEAAKRRGDPLDETIVEKIVRSVQDERRERRDS